MTTTNYYDTFIEVADDCPVELAEIPPKGEEPTVATIQFEALIDSPYRYTSDDVPFRVYTVKNKLSQSSLQEERETFFSKGQPCFRSSPLTKRYGWGIHSNAEGKIALYAVDSDEYKTLAEDKALKHLKAMRSKSA